MEYLNQIILGDSEEVLNQLPDNSFDLTFTSPPYSDLRSYGEISYEKLLNITKLCIQKSNVVGINIQNKCTDGERDITSYKLVVDIKEAGYCFIEEYIWSKTLSTPTANRKAASNSFEHIFIFCKDLDGVNFYPDELRTVYQPSSIKRYRSPILTERCKDYRNGEKKHHMVELNPKGAFPTNVLGFRVEDEGVHPAAFPRILPLFFILGYTKPGDIVLDPFCGSAQTCLAAIETNRKFCGIEIIPEYYELSTKRVETALAQLKLF